MATADFSQATSFDEQAAAWADFLIRDRMEKRENKVVPLSASIYPFFIKETDQGESFVDFPSIPDILPDFPTRESALPSVDNGAFAYLLLMPGVPTSDIEAKRIQVKGVPGENTIIKVRDSMIDEGEFKFYLMGVFISNQVRRCFCASFNGETFGPLRVGAAVGGPLEDLIDFEA